MADERDELDEVFDGLEMAWVDVAKARSIRARERKLAELAREMAYKLKHEGIDSNDGMKWLRRYEEALK